MSNHEEEEKEMENVYFIEKQEITVKDFECEDGWILDIGGGGEGIIGQIKGDQVIAIDFRKEELEETDNKALKIIMDARNMQFLDNSFETVTAFFTLMYIAHTKEDINKTMDEIARVTKPGGKFFLWDIVFDYPEGIEKQVIASYLKVNLPNGKSVSTGYGAKIHRQNMSWFISLAEERGFTVIQKKFHDLVYFIEFIKN
ncbi:class I SAM-dependent methyltransferase [Candidatus Lokiarchaeum ossiferum]|uniref:class I SAM-dependent methyltransferase n=1 Tax=Candidatus Lokiarchaeum ossiferum TaxID=2951803 RepID=UPI00352CFAE0